MLYLKLHLHMKSAGQMSSQSPMAWWYREMNCEVVGMFVEAVPVVSAESVDFLFNLCDLKILSEDHIRHVPWFIGYHAQDSPLPVGGNSWRILAVMRS
jgi:hypothetical protein